MTKTRLLTRRPRCSLQTASAPRGWGCNPAKDSETQRALHLRVQNGRLWAHRALPFRPLSPSLCNFYLPWAHAAAFMPGVTSRPLLSTQFSPSLPLLLCPFTPKMPLLIVIPRAWAPRGYQEGMELPRPMPDLGTSQQFHRAEF